MFTNSYKNAKYAINPATAGNGRKGLLPIKNTSGSVYYVGTYNGTDASDFYTYYGQIPDNVFSPNYDTSYKGWHVGNGSTPESPDDYALANIITSGISGTVTVSAPTIKDGKSVTEYTISITNTSSADKIIREIGCTNRIFCTSSLNGNMGTSKQLCLLARVVLPEDVVIPPSETVAFVVSIASAI